MASVMAVSVSSAKAVSAEIVISILWLIASTMAAYKPAAQYRSREASRRKQNKERERK
jgi:hypothetical protein